MSFKLCCSQLYHLHKMVITGEGVAAAVTIGMVTVIARIREMDGVMTATTSLQCLRHRQEVLETSGVMMGIVRRLRAAMIGEDHRNQTQGLLP